MLQSDSFCIFHFHHLKSSGSFPESGEMKFLRECWAQILLVFILIITPNIFCDVVCEFLDWNTPLAELLSKIALLLLIHFRWELNLSNFILLQRVTKWL